MIGNLRVLYPYDRDDILSTNVILITRPVANRKIFFAPAYKIHILLLFLYIVDLI